VIRNSALRSEHSLLYITFFIIILFAYINLGFGQNFNVNIHALLEPTDRFFMLSACVGSFFLFPGLQENKVYRIINPVFLFVAYFISFLLLIPIIKNPALALLGSIYTTWLAGILSLCICFFLSSNRKLWLVYILRYCLLPIFIFISHYVLQLTGEKYPIIFDPLLMAIDGTLGFYPSLLVGRIILSLPPILIDALNLLYLILPLLCVFVFKNRMAREGKPPLSLLIEFVLIGVIGFSLYGIIPACGSRFVFNLTWPNYLPLDFNQLAPSALAFPAEFYRSTFPSLHMAWVVCLFRNAFFCDKNWKYFIIFCCLGNLISIMGIGAHYFIDLVVGLGFANCIGGLVAVWHSQDRLAWQCFIVNGLMVALWYLLILRGLPFLNVSFLVAWSLILFSVGIGIFYELQLFRLLKKSLLQSKMP
jgi:hypothetical protein